MAWEGRDGSDFFLHPFLSPPLTPYYSPRMIANVALPLIALASSAFALPTHHLEPREAITTGTTLDAKWLVGSSLISTPARLPLPPLALLLPDGSTSLVHLQASTPTLFPAGLSPRRSAPTNQRVPATTVSSGHALHCTNPVR